METLDKFQVKLTFIIQSILPTFLIDMFSDSMANFDSSISAIWASSLSHINSFIGGAGSVVFALGSAFLSFLILIVFMIFFLLEGENFSSIFLHAVPGENYGLAKRMLEKTSNQIHAYIRGQLLAGTSVAITSIIFLYILQWVTGISIPYTFIIGISAGLFNLIPFIGPVMGMIPAIIIYLVTDQSVPIHIIYVLFIIGVFAIVQLIDNLIMSPYIMSDSVGLHPMLVIILVLLGASVSGILGMLFAVPIAAILKVIMEELNAAFNKNG
jgi:predicted PurR-regulated permease PerM